MWVFLGRSDSGPTGIEVGFGRLDKRSIRAWRKALAHSTREAGLPDSGVRDKRLDRYPLVRFGLRDHRKVELPLYKSDEALRRWGAEVAALYRSGEDQYYDTISNARPAEGK